MTSLRDDYAVQLAELLETRPAGGTSYAEVIEREQDESDAYVEAAIRLVEDLSALADVLPPMPLTRSRL